MKERQPRQYRNILVCYDNFRCVGWMTPEEFQELPANEVNWYSIKDENGQMTTFHQEGVKEDGPSR